MLSNKNIYKEQINQVRKYTKRRSSRYASRLVIILLAAMATVSEDKATKLGRHSSVWSDD